MFQCPRIPTAILCLGLISSQLAANAQTEKKDEKAKPKIDVSGTWVWERSAQDNTVQSKLKLQMKGHKVTGTYEGIASQGLDGPIRIEQGKVDGDKFMFQFSRETNDRTMILKFHGKVKDDSLSGNIDLEVGDQTRSIEWAAKRIVEVADIVGKWQFRITTTNDQVLEPSIVISQDGKELKGTYTGRSGELTAEELKVEKNLLTFQLSGERDGREWLVKYRVKPRGNSITGTVEYDFGENTGSIDVEGKRVVEREPSKPKDETRKNDAS